ncbi:MAG: hypothetical protein SFU86_10165 [Pirellulaceae bacterium]|nr:hypothetical protein [Pirellulaceae bacterium]
MATRPTEEPDPSLAVDLLKIGAFFALSFLAVIVIVNATMWLMGMRI